MEILKSFAAEFPTTDAKYYKGENLWKSNLLFYYVSAVFWSLAAETILQNHRAKEADGNYYYYSCVNGNMVFQAVKDETTGEEFALVCSFTERQKSILKAGGLLSYTKEAK